MLTGFIVLLPDCNPGPAASKANSVQAILKDLLGDLPPPVLDRSRHYKSIVLSSRVDTNEDVSHVFNPLFDDAQRLHILVL